jgi:hypothetical protein
MGAENWELSIDQILCLPAKPLTASDPERPFVRGSSGSSQQGTNASLEAAQHCADLDDRL